MQVLGIILLVEAAALATTGSPPLPIKGTPQITPEDYPRQAILQNEYGIVSTKLEILPDGNVSSCQVVESSGSRSLDSKTCSLQKSRAKFRPAMNADGVPIRGEYFTVTSWFFEPSQPSASIRGKMKVSEVPINYQSAVEARLRIGADGRVAECNISRSSGSHEADTLACSYALKEFRIAPLKRISTLVEPAAVRFLKLELVRLDQ
jgi:TonB family protein